MNSCLFKVVLFLSLMCCEALGAATFTVYIDNLIADSGDTDPGDGVALTQYGVTSLRSAIEEANALPGFDTIVLQRYPNSDAFVPLTSGPIAISEDLEIVGRRAIEESFDLAPIWWLYSSNTITVQDGVNLTVSDLSFDRQGDESTGHAFVVEAGASLVAKPTVRRVGHYGLLIGSDQEIILNNGGEVLLEDSSLGTFPAGNNGPIILNIGGEVRMLRSGLGGARHVGDGGAIFSDSGTVFLDTCNLHNSHGRSGGAIYGVNSNLILLNTTIADNQSEFSGGGVHLINSTMTMLNCTIAGNRAGTAQDGAEQSVGGGIRVDTDSVVLVGNTIIAANTGPSADGVDLSGEFASLGSNLIGVARPENGFASPGDMYGTPSMPLDPLFGPYDHTFGFPLLSGSPAIDAGNNQLLITGEYIENVPLQDIRINDSLVLPTNPDFYRFQGASVDIGSFEFESHYGVHTADQDSDFSISLTEVLRVIQFYNSGGYSCAEDFTSTEDGYTPGPDGTIFCAPHDLEFDVFDWTINLTELLRAIQFYNASGYGWCPASDTEDGYCPVNTF